MVSPRHDRRPGAALPDESCGRLRRRRADLADAARCTVLLTSMDDFAAVNEVYGEFFPGEPPARVTYAVAALPKGAAVEIDAVVAMPD